MASGSRQEEGKRVPFMSVVVPVFNEGAIVQKFYARFRDVALRCPGPYELILVDDGSSDDSFAHLLVLHQQDPAVKIIRLARNFGHQIAISAGLAHAAGEMVAVMDSDLQDPPEILPTMIGRLEEGYDIAYGVRSIRAEEGWFKRFTSHLFYRVLRSVAEIRIPLDAGDFCLMRRHVVEAMNRLPERNRFLRGLRSWFGFKQIGVPYERGSRVGGSTKFTFSKMFRFSLDGMLSFSNVPLRFASYLGFLASAVSFMGIGIVLYFRLFTKASIPGFATVSILVLFVGGIQLLTIGVLGEYLGRISDEVKQRPLYVTSALIGWESPPVPGA